MTIPFVAPSGPTAGPPSLVLAWTADVADPLLRALIPRVLREMGPGEVTRLCRLRPPARRRQFLAGHVLARLAVGQWLRESGLPDRSWLLDQDPDGRPTLVVSGPGDGAATPAGLSIGHSEGHVVVLVAPSACGVDVEATALADEVARHVLTAAEQRRLTSDERASEARRRWVVREALAKASGTPLAEVLLAVPRSGDPTALSAGLTPAGSTWSVATWRAHGADHGVVVQDASYARLTVGHGVSWNARPAEVSEVALRPCAADRTHSLSA